MRKIRVLVVDDAVVVRQLVSQILSEDPAIEVVGTAANGKIALSKIEQLVPDIVTLDIEMPEMNGMEVLAMIRRTRPSLPVIMFSTLTERGAVTTFEALALGAADYVTKPANVGSISESMQKVRGELLPRVKALCGRAAGIPQEVHWSPPAAPPTKRPSAAATARAIDVVAIGCSTGGPNALAELIPSLPANFPIPVVIVQHMPPIFTQLLADRLTEKSTLQVREARDGEPLLAGHVLVAPGGSHLVLRKEGLSIRAQLQHSPPENSCRPAVDVLFRSVTAAYGGRTLAAVLTGMGSDGLRGCQELRAVGAYIIAQDEASSIVWGMPGAIASAGLADRVLPLSQIGAEIVRRVTDGNPGWHAGAVR